MAAEFQVQSLFDDLPPAKPTPASGVSRARESGNDGYFNTTRLVGQQRQERQSKAKLQREQILQFFQANPNGRFGPSDVHKRMPWILLGSVRRSMTNLTAARKLIKTKQLQTGMHGAPEHIWHLNRGAA